MPYDDGWVKEYQDSEEWDAETDKAVDWLMTLRKFQDEGMSFGEALAKANDLFPEGDTNV